MKRKVLSALVMAAFAGVTVTTATAGVIQASYKNYAAEVFGSNAVLLTAPTIGYAIAQPLTGSAVNPNNFSITWTLSSGEWDLTVLPGAVLVSPDNGSALAGVVTAVPGSPNQVKATFTVTSNFTVGSQIILGLNTVAPPVVVNLPATITKVGTVLGAPAANSCAPAPADVKVTVKMTNAAGVEFETNFALAPLNNTTPIVQSNVASNISVVSSSVAAFDTDLATGNAQNREQSRVDVLIPSLGTRFTDGTADITTSAPAAGQIVLGQVLLKDNGALFDLDAANAYTVQKIIAGGGVGVTNGSIEVGTLNLTATGVFQAGGIVYIEPGDSAATCTIAVPTGAANAAVTIGAGGATSVNLTLSNAALVSALSTIGAADGARRINVCYKSAGAAVIIPTSQFRVTAGTLSKTGASGEATTQVCPGNLYNLESNGVRIDVRNYLPEVVKTASGWYSVLRVINTDEAQAASPIVQALLADGTLGATAGLAAVPSVDGKTGAFKAREVRYYTSTAIDAALAAAGNGAVYGAADVGGNARLRITSPTSSIRVQNYNYNPANGNFFEASAAQGDDGPDYARSADRDNK